MKKLLVFIALVVLLGCTKPMPEMPSYQTPKGKECAEECQQDYTDCMASDVRPDYLLMSPRESACRKLITGCYQLCLEKDK